MAKKKEKSVTTLIVIQSNKIKLKEKLINTTEKQTKLLSNDMYLNQLQINRLKRELEILKKDYAAMIVKSYKSRSEQSRAMFLLSSENFLQAYKRAQYMKQYAKHRKMQGENIKKKSVVLEELNQGLLEDKKKKQALINQNKLAKTKLSNELEEQNELISILKKDGNKFARQIQKKQKEANKIDKQIEIMHPHGLANRIRFHEFQTIAIEIEHLSLLLLVEHA